MDIPLYQERVHDLDYENLIFPDPDLKALLSQISQPKYLFTNGNAVHAKNCLARLEMTDLFQGVISFDSLQQSAKLHGIELDRRVVCKPHPDAYHLALKEIGAMPENTLFIDDSQQNILGAQELQMQTLLVRLCGF